MFTVNGKWWGRIGLGTFRRFPVKRERVDVDPLILHTGDIGACGGYVNLPRIV